MFICLHLVLKDNCHNLVHINKPLRSILGLPEWLYYRSQNGLALKWSRGINFLTLRDSRSATSFMVGKHMTVVSEPQVICFFKNLEFMFLIKTLYVYCGERDKSLTTHFQNQTILTHGNCSADSRKTMTEMSFQRTHA